ncbi:MAG: indole-3-glycerol phosphate synthase TrpC [Firmicutes bacterium]|nr:indole-3-glycerol phosphate synthase TrpC [Bacillota bacterium]
MLNLIAAAKKVDMERGGDFIMDSFARQTNLPVIRPFINMFAPAARVNLIAEVKKASPSKGIFREDFAPVHLAAIYEANGAQAISVITEEQYFLGSPAYVAAIRSATCLPLLRKDFIIDPRQLYESRLLGADAVLLIARLLPGRLLAMVELAQQLGLEPLIEAHDREELLQALDTPARVIGINNRNLQDFTVNIRLCLDLIALVPDHLYAVAESGISSPADMRTLERSAFRGALVGEALVTAADIGARVRELVNYQEDQYD